MPLSRRRAKVRIERKLQAWPGGLASFLRRNLLGKPVAGPSLPLDVGQP